MGSDKLAYQYTRPRGPIGALFSSPGPIYKLPTLIGYESHDFQSIHPKAPAYSFNHRHKDTHYDSSPGPAAYAQNAKVTNHGLMEGPSCSLKQRTNMQLRTVGPGPAQYLLKDDLVHPRSPQYRFGLRPQVLHKGSGPAPNTYSLPRPDVISGKCTAPQFTLLGRIEGLSTAKNPGPADYTVGLSEITRPAAPKFSMGVALPSIPLKAMPGPADYCAENVTLHRKTAPKFSIGIYHSPYKGDLTDTAANDLFEC